MTLKSKKLVKFNLKNEFKVTSIKLTNIKNDPRYKFVVKFLLNIIFP